MLKLDMWYDNTPDMIELIDWSFYAGEGYRGNVYSNDNVIGDFTADTLEDISNFANKEDIQ
jgi:hypothetical protein